MGYLRVVFIIETYRLIEKNFLSLQNPSAYDSISSQQPIPLTLASSSSSSVDETNQNFPSTILLTSGSTVYRLAPGMSLSLQTNDGTATTTKTATLGIDENGVLTLEEM